MNLLTETKEAITDSGHTPDDIAFIGSPDGGYGCSWEKFCALADADYHDGFGHTYVATDLRIYFYDNTMLVRWEYDGSEGWEYIDARIPLGENKPIKRVIGNGYTDTLAEMNPEEVPK